MSDDSALRKHNMEIVREYLDAINVWDFDKKRQLLADDAFFEMAYAPEPFPRSFRGKEEILSFVETIPAIIDSENLHEIWMDTLANDPGEIVCTYKSDMEIKPEGRRYRNRYITRWTIRDGKIAYFGEFYDPIELVKALGGSVEPGQLQAQEEAA
jgi:ketosteroid isomerase-like protein